MFFNKIILSIFICFISLVPLIFLNQTHRGCLLRKVWNLPYKSHTGIVHCTAQIPTVTNLLYDHFCSLFSHSISSYSSFLRSVFVDSAQYVYSFTGYFHKHYRYLSLVLIRKFRSLYGLNSPCEDIFTIISCVDLNNFCEQISGWSRST